MNNETLNEESSLAKIAAAEKEKQDATIEEVNTTSVETNDEDDDEAVVVMGTPTVDDVQEQPEKAVTSSESDKEIDKPTSITSSLSEDDLTANMPDMNPEAVKEALERINVEIDSFKKDLIINNGFTPEEAAEAAKKRGKKLAEDENKKYLEENPNLGIVTIDKSQEESVEFTKEEKAKLTKVKAIKLRVIEDVELATLKVDRVDKKFKSAALQSVDLGLSQYSIPLPLMHDYAHFSGAQIIQLVQAVQYEDSTYNEIITRKASLLYEHICNSANIKKYDEDGKIILSYNDFINQYLFHDLDLGLYGILVASSMEDLETELTCTNSEENCNTSFQWKYNIKQLLNLDDITDKFKAIFEDILTHKMDVEYLREAFAEGNKSIRVKSPITQNVYEFNYPTIARAINVFSVIDPNDAEMTYLSAIALFISSMKVYNTKTERYIEIEEDEIKTLLSTLRRVPQEEIDILLDFLRPYLYEPHFILESVCPNCGHKMKNDLPIESLVFLRANATSTEIEA